MHTNTLDNDWFSICCLEKFWVTMNERQFRGRINEQRTPHRLHGIQKIRKVIVTERNNSSSREKYSIFRKMFIYDENMEARKMAYPTGSAS